MDIKINGNMNINIQNEYLQRATENISDDKKAISERKDILKRSVAAYGKISDMCYEKSEVYTNTSNINERDSEQIITGCNRERTMIECIDILKSSVTPEDYSQLEAWGLIPDEDDPQSFVSVYERIQIELAAYCEDYDISGLNVSKEKMKTVLGSTSMANAISKAKDMATQMPVLSDEIKEYILSNDMEPTLENVYKAVHSGVSADGGDALSDEQWNQLKGQVESFFDTNGIENNSENLNSAKWIIASNLPLNVDNFEKLSALNKVDFSNSDFMEGLEADIAYTIYFGSDGMATDVTGNTFNMEKVQEAVETVNSAMDEDVDYILKNNKKLNIENLKVRIEERKREQKQRNSESFDIEDTYSQKNKVLAEARAILTSSSLFMMQKTGVSISYTEITVMIDMSHVANELYAEKLFALDNYVPLDEEKGLLTKTVEIMSGFSSLPVNVAASVYNKTIEYTPQAVYDEGQLLANRYKVASMTYEAVGTQVRADLGDSISKAFRNIDELLISCGVEVNDKNRRAARVLGYNATEITVESVEEMVDITSELDELTKNLTPRLAMHLIRNGINPLETNIKELNDMLLKLNLELFADEEDEKYSEYLWKLEKSKSITIEERDAYIQMYRIINHINRNDGSVAGAAIKAGWNMTLSNLYTAVKTKQAGFMDKKIDDTMGLFEGDYAEDNLKKYFENTIELMQDYELHKEYKYERIQQKFDSISELDTMSEGDLIRYISGMEGISVNNVYSAMTAGDRQLYKKLMDLKDEKIDRAVVKVSDVWNKNDESDIDTDKFEEKITGMYDDLSDSFTAENKEVTFDKAIERTDMRKVVSFMAGQARKRSYYIPMEISGETTMVHMTIRHGEAEEKGKISVYTETEEGRISVLMYAKEKGYETLAATDSIDIKNKLETVLGDDASVVYARTIIDGMWNDIDITDIRQEEVSYGELIRQAKSFIHNVLRRL